MKSFTFRLSYVLTLALLVISMGASAQWTYTVNYVQNGGNPGGLLTSDLPFGTTTIIPQSQAANSWSAPQTIPFAFDFAGTPVTQWKVSGNGVVTFDLGMALPGDNDALPSAQLAPMTIAGMWDSFTSSPPTGTNDYVRTITVGAAPNRQQWIMYYSYEIGSPNLSFMYWSIVLEETTNKIYVVDQYGSTSPLMSSTVGVQIDATTATMWSSSPNTPQGGNTSSSVTDNDYWEFQPLLMVACAGAPTVPAISASAPFVTNTTTSVDLAFSNTLPLISTTGLSYQWQSSLDGVTYTNIPGATGLTYSTTITASTYFQCVVTCANGGASTNSNSVQVELAPPPSITLNSVTPISCTTSINHTVSAEILVGSGTFAAPASCDYVFNLVDDFGDGWNGATMQILDGATVVATIGSSFTSGGAATETVSLQSGTTYTLFWNNGGFYAGEVGISVVDPSGTTIYTLPVFSAGSVGTTLTTITGSCPSNAITFTYSYDGGITNNSGTITNTSANTYTAEIPLATPTNAPVSWTISATNSYGLVTTLSGSYQDNPTLGFTATAQATPATICAGELTSLSVSVSPVATYAAAPVSSAFDEDISNVTIISSSGDTLINNTSTYQSLEGTVGTATGIAGRYSDFSALTNIPMVAGSTYNFAVSSYDTPWWYNNSLAIFIDYNKDGDFLDAGEMVYQPAATTNGPHTETGSFTVPSWVFGTMRMRVVCLETLISSYTTNSSWGEREDYTITVSSGATWFAGTTSIGNGTSLTQAPSTTTDYSCEVMAGICPLASNTVTVTVNQLPASPIATNSTQCGTQAPTASVASNAGVDGTGMYYWFDAATAGNLVQNPPVSSTWSTFYTADFTSGVATGASIFGSANTTNVAGWLELTAAANSLNGAISVDAGVDAPAYKVEFDVQTTSGGADGFSWSFAPDADPTALTPAAEMGTGTGVKISFDAYGGMPNAAGTYVLYNSNATSFSNTTAGVLAYDASTAWLGSTSAHVIITINEAGELTLNVDGTDIFTNVALPAAYLSSNKASWTHVIKGRTGGLNMQIAIDNLDIQYKTYTAGSTTFVSPVSSNTTFYVSELGTNGCLSVGSPVTIAVSQPAAIDYANSASAICIGESVTLNMSSVITPPYTYTITSSNPAAAVVSPAVGATQTFTPTASGTISYIVTAENGNCTEVDTVDISVVPNASPAPIIALDTLTICPSATSAAFTAGLSSMDVPYTFNLFDSYGDGWNGNALKVLINGVLSETLTFTSGSSYTATVIVPEGSTVTTEWTTGSFLSECSFEIVVGGAIIHTANMTTSANIASQMYAGSVPAYNYTIQWYDAPTGGTLLGTGTTLETIGTTVLPNLNTIGQYTVYAVQSNACLSPATPAIVNVTNVLAEIVPIDATCNSVANGSFSLGTITCGTTPFDYSVDGGAFGSIPTNLAYGSHTVVIQDATGAVAPAVTIFIDEPTWITNVPNFVDNGWACKDETSEFISVANPNLQITDTIALGNVSIGGNGSATLNPALNLPVGAVITGATLNINGLTTAGGTWASDLSVVVSGLGTLNQTPSGFTVTNVNYSYPLGNIDPNGNAINVVVSNTYGFGTAVINNVSLIVSYTIQQTLDNITWYAAPAGGTALGSGFSIESVGTTVLPNTATPGIYNFYAQGELNGCSSFTRQLVTVEIQAPTIVANVQSATVCPGDFLTLNATGGLTYTWDNGITNNTPFVPSPSSLVGESQTYVVNGFDIDGCANQDTVSVTVLPQPVLNAGVDQAVCDGTPVILNATSSTSSVTPVTTYQWSNNVTNNTQFVPTNTATITVTATGANGCTSEDDVVITVLALPVVDAGQDFTVCAGLSATLNASGAVSYAWDNGVTQGIPFYPNATQTYTVVGTAANGCTNDDQVMVTVSTGPSLTISGAQTVCANSPAALSAAVQNSLGGFWTTTNGLGVLSPNATNSAVTYTPTVNDPSVVDITYVATNACGSASQSTTITVLPIPTVDAGADFAVCDGQTATLTANGTGALTWTNPNITNGVAFTPVTTTTYTVVATGANNCTNSDDVVVTVLALPDVDAGMDQTICSGESVTLNGQGAVSYSWTGGVSNGVAFSPASTATYTVTGTGVNGCESSDQVVVIVNATPAAMISVVDDVTLTATPAGMNYQWINCASGTDVPNGSTDTYVATQNGSYAVIVTSLEGCSDQSDCELIDAVGLEQANIIEMSVQPNPTAGELQINMPASITATAEVFDAQGKLVQSANEVTNGTILHLESMTTGVYMVRIATTDAVQTFRVVKQ